MAKFKKQKNGLYRTAIRLGYDLNGKPIQKYFSAQTIKELEQKIFEAKANLANGMVVSDATTFGDYAQKWLIVYKANKSIYTRNMYKSKLTYMDSIKNTPLKKVNRLMIQKIINENAEHPRTCELILITFKQIFKSAIGDGLVNKSPCTEIEMPRHVPLEKRALTSEEKRMLRSAVLLPEERLLLLVLYGTGCRPGEALALTKSDFDWKKGTVNINKSAQFDNSKFYKISVPKTNASIRSVIVSESILRGLRRLIDKIPNERIFADSKGDMCVKTHYDHVFECILKKAGLTGSGITMYTLRHNFATECYYAGVSLKECMRQMGHASIKMVMEVYAHLDEQKESTRSKMSSMVM